MPYKDPEKQRQARWRYTRKFDKYPIMIYNQIRARIRLSPYYKKRKLEITKDEFIRWMLNNPNYELLYENWRAANYTFALAPSIDRIDNTENYTLNNIQLLTVSQNSKKAIWLDKTVKNNIPIRLSDGRTFESISAAARSLKVKREVISQALKGIRKDIKGYTVERLDDKEGTATSSDSISSISDEVD